VNVTYVDRTGATRSVAVTLVENPHLEIVDTGSLTPAQRAFRDRWLSAQSK
jgi:hypothetical protein